MPLHHKPYFGFVLGFIFGTVGMWALALLSLAYQPVELITGPLFAPGRYAGTFLAQNGSMGNGSVMLLFLFNGVLFGLIGWLIQKVDRKLHRGM